MKALKQRQLIEYACNRNCTFVGNIVACRVRNADSHHQLVRASKTFVKFINERDRVRTCSSGSWPKTAASAVAPLAISRQSARAQQTQAPQSATLLWTPQAQTKAWQLRRPHRRLQKVSRMVRLHV